MAQTLLSKPPTILLNLLQRKAFRAPISFTGLNQLRVFFVSRGDAGSEGGKPVDCDTSNDAKFHVENMVVDKLSYHTTEIAHKDFELNPYLTTIDDKFSVLLKAKDWTAAYKFLFNCKGHCKSEVTLFERFVGGLCSYGKVSEAFDVILRMKGIGLQPTLCIWNSIMMGSLRMGRTDQVWQVYKDMTESGLVINIQTFGFLIQALCKENRLDEAYDLLHEVLNMGLEVPDVVTFRELIAGFCKACKYDKVSQLLHLMIMKNCMPDLFTYQEIIYWLCKNRKVAEGLHIFHEIIARGYNPSVFTYTIAIYGLCRMQRVSEARGLWDQMIKQKIVPKLSTYNVLINGYCKMGMMVDASKLYKEMCLQGYRANKKTFGMLIDGYCSIGRKSEATKLLEEMLLKGFQMDVITYNNLIQAFCKQGDVSKAIDLYQQLLESEKGT